MTSLKKRPFPKVKTVTEFNSYPACFLARNFINNFSFENVFYFDYGKLRGHENVEVELNFYISLRNFDLYDSWNHCTEDYIPSKKNYSQTFPAAEED